MAKNKLRKLMDRRGVRPCEVAAKTGLSEITVSHLYYGYATNPRRGTIEKIIKALDVSFEEIF